MDIQEAYDIIHSIAEGFEENVMQCLESHSDNIVLAIQAQIYSGQDGRGQYLAPTYDDDKFFEEDGPWYHRAEDYKAWKNTIA